MIQNNIIYYNIIKPMMGLLLSSRDECIVSPDTTSLLNSSLHSIASHSESSLR